MLSSRSYLPQVSRCWQCWPCTFTTSAIYRQAETRAPPLLAKFRVDMKEALKAKDKARLNVLRGILTETTTLEKQAQGITSNKQLFKLLQKRKRASIGAAKEFQAAGREDLTAKENEQAGILQEYLDVFDTASTNEVTAAIQAAIQNVISEGDIPKKENIRALLFRKGGAFEDKVVDDGLVAKTIDRLVHEAAPPTQSPEVTTT